MTVPRAHDASADVGRRVLRVSDGEVLLWCPSVRPRSSSYMKGNSELLATRCGIDVAVRLDGPLQAADILTETVFRVDNRAGICRARTPVKPPSEAPITMAGGRRSRNRTEGSAPSSGP
jgi:hypothetical protein